MDYQKRQNSRQSGNKILPFRFSRAWLFKQTIKHLIADERGYHRYFLTDPHLLYLSDQQSGTYLDVMQTPQYTNRFHSSTVEIINDNLERLCRGEGDTRTFIDLGPGYPDKTLPMVKYLRSQRIKTDYCPIDINKSFLNLAEKAMSPFVNSTSPINSNFLTAAEKVPTELRKQYVHCILGLTFMNFAPQVIIPQLKALCGSNGSILLAAEVLNDPMELEGMLEVYRRETARNVAFGPLANLGFNQEQVNYKVSFKGARIEMAFTVKHCTMDQTEKTGLKSGDEVVTAISYRYTPNQLREILKTHFKDFEIIFSEDLSTAIAIC